jgi:hypothetical protein
MRLGEVPFAPDVEQALDTVKVEKERVAAAAGEESIRARLDDIRLGAEGDLGIGDYLRSYRFIRSQLRARRHEYVNGLPAVLRLREHIAECDVRQVIAVVIDINAINCVGMKCIRVGLGVRRAATSGPGKFLPPLMPLDYASLRSQSGRNPSL